MNLNNSKALVESHIVLGYKCNHSCIHCVVQVKRKLSTQNHVLDLSTDEAISAISTAITNGATKIVLTGGEPTLRDDISELVSFCLSNGCRVQIQTNGSCTNKISQICHIAGDKTDFLEFMIPLHSNVAADNDLICKCSDGFSDTISSLEYLSKRNINIIGKIVLTKYTGNLYCLYKIYEDFHAQSVIIAYPHCVSFPLDQIKDVDLTREECRKIFQEFYAHNLEIPVILQAFPRCFVGDIPQALIQEELPEFLSTEVVEHQFRTIDGHSWHYYRKLDKRKFSNCSECDYDQNCEGIWKDYFKAYGNQ